MLRNTSVDLSYLPRVSKSFKMTKTATGNSFNDFVTRQASGLGLDPNIFLNKQFFEEGNQSIINPSQTSNVGQPDQFLLSVKSSSFNSS